MSEIIPSLQSTEDVVYLAGLCIRCRDLPVHIDPRSLSRSDLVKVPDCTIIK